MKITFSNLGTIKKTTLDLRPLTVIIGPNNSNKTYIAHSIYGLWELLRDIRIDLAIKLELEQIDAHTFTTNAEKFFQTLEVVWNNKIIEFRDNLDFFFQDSSGKLFKKTDYNITISKEDLLNRFQETYRLIGSGNTDLLTLNFENDLIKFTYDERELFLKIFVPSHGLDSMHVAISYILTRLFSTPFLLPAERNAFIITYKMLAIRRYEFSREIFNRHTFNRHTKDILLDIYKDQEGIHYPQPVEDFLNFLTSIELNTNINSNSENRDKFQQLANYIESSIQGNNKTNFNETKFGGKEIKIHVKKGLDIDLHNASSSIKQLAPLLLYLRYRAQENDLLIIDEPEMNLHPESQAKFLEILGMLVNAGVNVLLTTHSPYFMSHLNNLVSGKTGDDKTLEEQAKSLYLKDERAFLSMDDVSAYEMKNNKLVSLKDKDYGIRWDTLSDVSADIQQKFFEIYEKGEEPTNGEEK